MTSQKINQILKANGLNIAKRDGYKGWWTTQEAGFSTMKAGNGFQVTYYRTSNKSAKKLIAKAKEVIAAAGLKVSDNSDLSFYVDTK